VNWATKIITVPQAYLTHITGAYYTLDVNQFRLDLKNLEDGEEGMIYPDTHRHNTEVTVGGITLARTVEIINDYTVTFEDGQYVVRVVDEKGDTRIGDSSGTPMTIAQLVTEMKSGFLELKKKLGDKKHKPRVYVEEWHMNPTAAGNWVTDLIEVSQGQAMLRKGERSRQISLQEIQAFDPQVIIISLCGFKNNVNKRLVTERPGWQELSAVKNDKVFVIDDSLLNRPGPRLVEGAEKISEIMHPEVMKLKRIKQSDKIKQISAEYKPNWVQDPVGYFLVKLDRERKKIQLGFCREKNIVEVKIEANNSRALVQEVIKQRLISRFDHAAYLGRELFKAEIALKTGNPYTQDNPLILK